MINKTYEHSLRVFYIHSSNTYIKSNASNYIIN